MSERFHMNFRGEPRMCGSVDRECRFGGDAEHFPSFDEAREEFESWMAPMTIPPPIVKVWHVTRAGVVEQCRYLLEECPFGREDEHFRKHAEAGQFAASRQRVKSDTTLQPEAVAPLDAVSLPPSVVLPALPKVESVFELPEEPFDAMFKDFLS